MKVLIVEDEPTLRKLEKRYLERNKIQVDEAGTGDEALEMLSISQYDCILLDLNLPEKDGIQVAKELREKQNDVPIVMVTARSQMYDKLRGFDSGADDYITKPFDMKELLARVKAVIKRSSMDKNDVLRLEDMKIFPDRNVVQKGEKEISLSNKEMGILEYLLRNREVIVSAEELLEHVWDSNVDMFSDTVKTHIKTLRKKVDPKKKYIKTVRGKGYIIK
ncbi:response regulator transcription factor [bacterium]|nr:response regulator transcription factor [bacterium]